MAEIINLRLARKARARREAEQAAAANRARHGETRAAKDSRRLDAEREARKLDGTRREAGDAPGEA